MSYRKKRDGGMFLKLLAIFVGLLIFFVVLFSDGHDSRSVLMEVRTPEVYTEPLVVAVFDSQFRIVPLGARAAELEVVEDTKVRYVDAYTNTDVVQTTEAYRLKEDIVLKEPGHPDTFSYQLDVEGLEWEVTPGGDIVFYTSGVGDRAFRKRFTIPAPYMIDAEGVHSGKDAVETTLSPEGVLTLVPDPRWLAEHTYPIILDPTVEISVLNIQSHPQQGDDWDVRFTTVGQADLYIIPDDQATIDDDVFTSLTCDGQSREPEILEDDVIYYEDWECEGVGEVVHYTAVAGKHTLRFEFGGQVAYAYNDPGDTWWNTDWGYRKEITIESDNVFYTGTFPVLVTTTDNDLRHTGSGGNVGNSDGTDIAFTDDAGSPTQLDHELESYTSGTGAVVAWVEASVSASADTSIYIYYGNGGVADQQDIEGTWDSNFVLVQHLDETSGGHVDSTSNNNDSSTVSVTTQGSATGWIGGADDFDGTDDYVQISDSATLDITNVGSIEAWIETDDVSSATASFSSWRNDLDDPDGGGPNEWGNVDMTVIGDTIYYASAICSGSTETFETATSDLNGDNFSGWTTRTAFDGCGSGEGPDIAIDSDGVHLYYAVLAVSDTTANFQATTSTTDFTFSPSGWGSPADPTGSASGEGSGIDLTIVGDTVYYSAVLLSGSTEDFEIASIGLDGSGWSGWDESVATPAGGGGSENCTVGTDSDGDIMYYAVNCHSGSTETYQTTTSNLDGTSFASWTGRADPTGSSGGDLAYGSIIAVGDQMYHAIHLNEDGIDDYDTADSYLDGTGFSASWTSRVSGGLPSGAGAAESGSAAMASDGKRIYYGALGVDETTEQFVFASSTVSSFPFVAKQSAYELIQSGGGFMFDWAGSPKSFGTSTAASTYTHVAVTQDGSTMNYYIDGELKRSQDVTTDFVSNASDLFFGRTPVGNGTNTHFNGRIDEVRISNTARSATWYRTQINNQQQMTEFLSFGSQEEPQVNNDPTVTSVTDTPDPTNPKRSVTFTVDWNDDDSGEVIKAKVCKTSGAVSAQNCPGGASDFWASSTGFTTKDPLQLVYDVEVGDAGQTRNYYVFVCDDGAACSALTSVQTFSVNGSSVVPNVIFR